MLSGLKAAVVKKIQKLFWVYLTDNFVITGSYDCKMAQAASQCELVPITQANYSRVCEFRDEDRVLEYGEKLAREEIGFFAECGWKMVGSIWATRNREQAPMIARAHVRLMPNEALIHDIVTGESSRGMGVGPFMVSRIAAALLGEYGISKIIIDVNVKNHPSLRMMEKAGLRANQRVFSVSAFGTLAFEKVLRHGV